MPRDPSLISLGAGRLFIAPVGAVEPTTVDGALDAAWTDLGYTSEGSELSYTIASENIDVAEEIDPVRVMQTGREITIAFALAQVTAANLRIAMNGGTITTPTGATTTTFAPPDLDDTPLEHALLWQSEGDAAGFEERWLFRRVRNTGDITIARRKAPDIATIPVTFTAMKPSGTAAPFVVYFGASRV